MKRSIILSLLMIVVSLSCVQTSRKVERSAGNNAVNNDTIPELVVQEWHDGDILHGCYSADDKYLFSATNTELKIWEISSGLLVRTLTKIDDIRNFSQLKLSPTENYFICQNSNGDVVARDFLNNTVKVVKRTLDSDGEKVVLPFAFSNNGKFLAMAYKSTIDVYDTTSWMKSYSLNSKDIVYNSYTKILFSPNSSYIVATGKKTGEPKDWGYFFYADVWQTSTKKLVRTSEMKWHIRAIDISHDEKYVAFGFYTEDRSASIVVQDIHKNKEISRFYRKKQSVNEIKFSPTGNSLYSVSYLDEPSVRLWDFKTGKELDFVKVEGSESIAFSPDEKKCAIFGKSIEIRNLSDGKLVQSIVRPSDLDRFSYKMNTDMTFAYKYLENGISVFASDFSRIFSYADFPKDCKNPCAFDDGFYYIDGEHNLVKFDINRKSAEKIVKLESGFFTPYSSKGGRIVVCGKSEKIIIVNTETRTSDIIYLGKFIGKFIADMTVSLKGRFVAVKYTDYDNYFVDIYDILSGKNKTLSASLVGDGCFSADEKYYATSVKENNKQSLKVYDTKTWQIVKSFDGNKVAFSLDGKKIAIYSSYDTSSPSKITVYDVSKWSKISEFLLKSSFHKFCFSSDGKKIIGNNYGGTIFCYSAETGDLLSSTVVNTFGDWLTYTPEGYFNGSEGGINKFVHLVNGMEVFELGQVAETLYRPDLVAAKLRGEDISSAGVELHGSDSSVMQELVSSGNAPVVQFASVPQSSARRDVTVSFTVQDTGGGIGSVYISVNGRVSQLAEGSRAFELVGGGTAGASQASGTRTYSPSVTLQDGENVILAYATNAAGKIESRRAEAKITWRGQSAKPGLYVLAVGVNDYAARGVSKLRYAVPDVEAVAQTMQSSGRGTYGAVNVTRLTDARASSAGIEAEFSRLSSVVKPDDVFVLYISGHGTSYNGDYYFIPSDFDGNLSSAVSKAFIMRNVQKIAAQRALVILDTCYSGAIMNDSDTTAYQRLARSTGLAVLAASSDVQSALEGYEGHGVFTWALLEGLTGKADLMRDDSVTLMELATYLSGTVPALTERLWDYRQVPWHDTRGQDFVLVGK